MNAVAQAIAIPVASRLIDNGDDTVTDSSTGLMWSKPTNSKKCITHEKAEKICAELDLAGHTDWRMPTVDELFALADRTRHSPAIDTDAFPGTKNDWYWSSTISAWGSSYAWVVDFSLGGASGLHRGYNFAFVRAVRSLPAGQ